LVDVLQEAYRQQGIAINQGRTLREFLLMGPNGALKGESVWEGDRLITVTFFGGGS